MALTRKFLQAMGIESEKIDEIITAHRETVDALKEERDKFKDDAEKLPDVQKNLDKATAKITELEGEEGKDKWKVKYDALKEESDKYKAGVEAEKLKHKRADAYKALLKEVGVSDKRIDSILRVTDLDKIEFDEEGKLKESNKLKEEIKKEWSDFITQKESRGAETETPPAGGANGGSKDHAPSRAAQVAQRHYELVYGTKTEDKK